MVYCVKYYSQTGSVFFQGYLFFSLLCLDMRSNLDAAENVAAEGVDHPGRANEPGATAGEGKKKKSRQLATKVYACVSRTNCQFLTYLGMIQRKTRLRRSL